VFLAKANALLAALHFTIRIAGRGELVEIQNPLEAVVVIAEYWIKFVEWNDDETVALQPGTDLIDQAFWRKSLRVHWESRN